MVLRIEIRNQSISEPIFFSKKKGLPPEPQVNGKKLPGRHQSIILGWSSSEYCLGVRESLAPVPSERGIFSTEIVLQKSKSVQINEASRIQSRSRTLTNLSAPNSGLRADPPPYVSNELNESLCVLLREYSKFAVPEGNQDPYSIEDSFQDGRQPPFHGGDIHQPIHLFSD